MDLFVVPTISFRLLYGLLIMGHGRRQILWFGVTAHPTAESIANQLTQACGWEQIPRYLIRDRDGANGEIFMRRVRSIGIRDRPTSPRSPWQNAYAERLIGRALSGGSETLSLIRSWADCITNMPGFDLR
jgi:transposase InsO family protein